MGRVSCFPRSRDVWQSKEDYHARLGPCGGLVRSNKSIIPSRLLAFMFIRPLTGVLPFDSPSRKPEEATTPSSLPFFL
jgi:hypothetical protein